MFVDIEAEVSILVGGDDTYHAANVLALVERLVLGSLDIIIGARVELKQLHYLKTPIRVPRSADPASP
jgi:hypothetical protein